MGIKEILNIAGLSFNLIGAIILGFAIIKSFGDIYFESFRTMHTVLFKKKDNKEKFKRIKNKMISYLKKNPKSFKYYKDLTGNDITETNFHEDEFYLNIFQYVSLRKSRSKGLWGIIFIFIGFLLQIISFLINLNCSYINP